MTCREVVDFLMDYLGGDLPAAERAVFEAHLGKCPPCVAYLDMYKATVRLGKAACCDENQAREVPEDLVQAILAARRRVE